MRALDTSTEETISLGLSTLDDTIIPKGIPVGNVGMIASNPQSNIYQLFLRMIVENSEKEIIFATAHRTPEEVESHLQEWFNVADIPDVVSVNNKTNLQDIIEREDFNTYDLFILDNINYMYDKDGDESNSISHFKQLNSIAHEHDMVAVIHYLETTSQDFQYSYPQITYMMDYIFGLLKRRQGKSIRQHMMYSRFPPGTSLNQSETKTPYIEIEYLDTQISTDMGGSI